MMKRILSIVLLLTCVVSLAACGKTKVKEISCEEIIAAYESAGYYVVHGEHSNEEDSSQLCYIKASISEDSNSYYIYFVICFTEKQAKAAAETDKYNLLIWLYGTANGEGRWLKTGTYGNIEYSYYNARLIKPFKELI